MIEHNKTKVNCCCHTRTNILLEFTVRNVFVINIRLYIAECARYWHDFSDKLIHLLIKIRLNDAA